MTHQILAAAALLLWLPFWWRVVFRRNDSKGEVGFLMATVLLALVWTGIATARSEKHEVSIATARGCAVLREGMTKAEMTLKMGDPSRKVTEADTRGPGAEAWVYDDARCVAHVLEERVRSVEYE